ncbi:MAG: 50S ribosomal protein L18 [Betaproteobacteria bacterium TMED156]|nr:MAG: 50S ribosomal protein L18 [Betaproteobacteria bacterium TMED156]
MNKKNSRLRRAKKTRFRISDTGLPRLSVHRTNLHIYASIFNSSASQVLVSASTVEEEIRSELKSTSGVGGNIAAATLIGKRVADKAKKVGINEVAFDRSGFRYHGRIKALADAARESGLKF